jgi:hypothetical protein
VPRVRLAQSQVGNTLIISRPDDPAPQTELPDLGQMIVFLFEFCECVDTTHLDASETHLREPCRSAAGVTTGT